jgi:thioesterase domain-containing protein
MGTVEEMATFYVEEMQTMQPDGPYFLGGASFGGLAAYEMAQQLVAKGHRVALLALFDTTGPGYPRLLADTSVLRAKAYRFVGRVQHHRDSLRMLSSRGRVRYVLDMAKKFRKKYYRKFLFGYKKAGRKVYSMLKRPIPKDFIQIEDRIAAAGRNYVPHPYPGKVTLFRAAQQPLGIYPDPTLGWQELAALQIHEVPGHHGSLVKEPFVSNLAEVLRHCIDTAHLESYPCVERAQLIEPNSEGLTCSAA